MAYIAPQIYSRSFISQIKKYIFDKLIILLYSELLCVQHLVCYVYCKFLLWTMVLRYITVLSSNTSICHKVSMPLSDSHSGPCLCHLSFALKCRLVVCTHVVLILFIPLVWRWQQPQWLSLCVWRSDQHLMVTTDGHICCKGKVFAHCDWHLDSNI